MEERLDSGDLLQFGAGLVLLIVGAEALVRGSARLAAGLGVSPLIIGLTVVAFGTSSPEIVVSIQASLAGRADIALGNVVGSNIFNVLFILGVSAVVSPLIVSEQLVRHDVPIMIGASSLVMLLAMNNVLSPLEGVVLLVLLASYIAFLIWLSQRRPHAAAPTPTVVGGKRSHRGLDIAFIVAGLILVVLGAHWLVFGAVGIARVLGISELVIGLTIVAAGTSLPEVATSVVAAFRGERDIAVGNVVGSNIFNLLAVLGPAAIVGRGMAVPAAALTFDLPVMVAVAMACLPIFFLGLRIPRWIGAVFLVYYAAYVTFILLDATDHQALPVFSGFMLLFVVPITVLTFSVVLVRSRASGMSDTEKPG